MTSNFTKDEQLLHQKLKTELLSSSNSHLAGIQVTKDLSQPIIVEVSDLQNLGEGHINFPSFQSPEQVIVKLRSRLKEEEAASQSYSAKLKNLNRLFQSIEEDVKWHISTIRLNLLLKQIIPTKKATDFWQDFKNQRFRDSMEFRHRFLHLCTYLAEPSFESFFSEQFTKMSKRIEEAHKSIVLQLNSLMTERSLPSPVPSKAEIVSTVDNAFKGEMCHSGAGIALHPFKPTYLTVSTLGELQCRSEIDDKLIYSKQLYKGLQVGNPEPGTLIGSSILKWREIGGLFLVGSLVCNQISAHDENGKELRRFSLGKTKKKNWSMTSLEWASIDSFVAGTSLGNIQYFTLLSDKPQKVKEYFDSSIEAITKLDSFLLVGDSSGKLFQIRVSDLEIVWLSDKHHEGGISMISIASSSPIFIATIGQEGTVKVMNFQTKEILTAPKFDSEVWTVLWSPNLKYLILEIGGDEEQLVLFDPFEKKDVILVVADKDYLYSSYLVTSQRDATYVISSRQKRGADALAGSEIVRFRIN